MGMKKVYEMNILKMYLYRFIKHLHFNSGILVMSGLLREVRGQVEGPRGLVSYESTV